VRTNAHAEVAQLVEQRTENAWVPSSSLGFGTKAWYFARLFILFFQLYTARM
jgi:hypothetical protein